MSMIIPSSPWWNLGPWPLIKSAPPWAVPTKVTPDDAPPATASRPRPGGSSYVAAPEGAFCQVPVGDTDSEKDQVPIADTLWLFNIAMV